MWDDTHLSHLSGERRKGSKDGPYYWSYYKKKSLWDQGHHCTFIVLFIGPFTTSIHKFHWPIFREKRVAAGDWPSPAQLSTLNQELTVTQLSLAILMRNLVLLDYCSWATSCQQFLRKLFNHPQLQRNRWRTGKKIYSEVYALVKSKFKDTMAKDDTNSKGAFSPEKWTNRYFCFPSPFKLWTTPVISTHTHWGDLFDFSEPFNI